ncbi:MULTISPECIES: DUF2490 domain-containing protein [Flavobacterium]|jgi:hypothetical protein|uniref:DUF2490 domain-containing protein n=1 Tax=Flavobacterium cupriresistens TaxID=2893885 RepID=A0ABU4R871_9FLAO|nr:MULTISPECIES: DUF2490 domain-containing protein [unclassified Flavobacterium]KLT68939.1 hypothetical protein AB674_15335 [Flavobacterium sp. ABG]MDX6188768.1 DUF2490 domain-containing protein [Flavobacterium sp. Fl-318]UFH44446.1 DUF2490 domain-containing protein [Flavobacterium sp. F-323]
MKILRIVLFLSLTSPFLQAQKKTDQQTLTWIRYYNIFPLTEKWSIHTELDNRSFVNPIHENLFVVRVQGRYRANKTIDLGGGFAYFNVNTQDPRIDPNFSVPEYRGQQDITLINDIAKITFHNRFQIEERFMQKASRTELLDDFSFSWRFRYRLQSTFTLWEKDKRNLKGTISDEILLNYGKDNKRNTFDQNRIYAALRYHFNPNIGLELGYMKSFQRRASGVDFYDRDIIRFTVYHKINRKTKA